METKYSSLIQALEVRLDTCKTENELSKIKADFLGKNGLITKEFSTILDAEDKKYTGQQLNLLKNHAERLIADSLVRIKDLLVSDNAIDVSLPGRNISEGTRHPISITINHISDIMPDVDMTSTFTDEDGNEKEFTVPMTVTFLWPNAGI